jgi:hypothetical protein
LPQNQLVKPNLLNLMPGYDLKRSMKLFGEIYESYLENGGAALILLQDGLEKQADWCIQRIKNEVYGQYTSEESKKEIIISAREYGTAIEILQQIGSKFGRNIENIIKSRHPIQVITIVASC